MIQSDEYVVHRFLEQKELISGIDYELIENDSKIVKGCGLSPNFQTTGVSCFDLSSIIGSKGRFDEHNSVLTKYSSTVRLIHDYDIDLRFRIKKSRMSIKHYSLCPIHVLQAIKWNGRGVLSVAAL